MSIRSWREHDIHSRDCSSECSPLQPAAVSGPTTELPQPLLPIAAVLSAPSDQGAVRLPALPAAPPLLGALGPPPLAAANGLAANPLAVPLLPPFAGDAVPRVQSGMLSMRQSATAQPVLCGSRPVGTPAARIAIAPLLLQHQPPYQQTLLGGTGVTPLSSSDVTAVCLGGSMDPLRNPTTVAGLRPTVTPVYIAAYSERATAQHCDELLTSNHSSVAPGRHVTEAPSSVATAAVLPPRCAVAIFSDIRGAIRGAATADCQSSLLSLRLPASHCGGTAETVAVAAATTSSGSTLAAVSRESSEPAPAAVGGGSGGALKRKGGVSSHTATVRRRRLVPSACGSAGALAAACGVMGATAETLGLIRPLDSCPLYYSANDTLYGSDRSGLGRPGLDGDRALLRGGDDTSAMAEPPAASSPPFLAPVYGTGPPPVVHTIAAPTTVVAAHAASTPSTLPTSSTIASPPVSAAPPSPALSSTAGVAVGTAAGVSTGGALLHLVAAVLPPGSGPHARSRGDPAAAARRAAHSHALTAARLASEAALTAANELAAPCMYSQGYLPARIEISAMAAGVGRSATAAVHADPSRWKLLIDDVADPDVSVCREYAEVGVCSVGLGVWAAIISVEGVLLRYFESWQRRGGRVVVSSVSLVRGRVGLGPQIMHRDHSLGAGYTVMLVVSLDGSGVTTQLVPGSHASGYVDAADPVFVEGAGGHTALAFDGACLHRGTPIVTGGSLNRLLITFAYEAPARFGKPDAAHADITNRALLSHGCDTSEGKLVRVPVSDIREAVVQGRWPRGAEATWGLVVKKPRRGC